MAGGRPSKYSGINLDQVRKMAEYGLIDRQMADVLGISEDTFNEYKKKPEFAQALKAGKKISDEKVEMALFQRATGYSHDDVHVSNYQGYVTVTPITKHYAPDTAACIFWLKNRKPKDWKDKVTVAGDPDDPIGVVMYPVKKAPGDSVG